MTSSRFDFSHFLFEAAELRKQLVEALEASPDEKVQGLLEGVPEFGGLDGSPSSEVPLSVAFIGQYNAGKSTILSALTERRDIPIDGDVCTDKVTAYDWNGIRLLDTPGIHAGYPEHDEKTYSVMDRADLLVFTITNELFDDLIGAHFRELCFKRDKAAETILVVNKMSQDPGTPEIKLPDVERVTKPLSASDFRTTFIDAQAFLEATDEDDPEDRADLLELSRFNSFVDALNGFVQDNGLMGRLTSPLFQMRAMAQQAEAFLAVDMPEERAAIELLNRKRGLLLGSRSRLRGTMSGLVSAAASDLIAIGDAVAESVEPGVSESSVQAKHDTAQKRARGRCEQLSADGQTAVEAEITELQTQLKALEDGVLARKLKQIASTDGLTGQDSVEVEKDASGFQWKGGASAPAEWPGRAKQVADIADGLGKFAAKWATGPMASGGDLGSMTAARGSEAHQVVYNVGKFFGVKFQPWGAVKVARAIGNAGRVIAAVGGVLAVVAQIVEEVQLDEYKQQLREARDGIRASYRESVRSIEATFWARFDSFCEDFYDSELGALDEVLTDLVDQRTGKGEEAGAFALIATQATGQIERIQGNS